MERILLSETAQETALAKAVEALKAGGIVVFPTETMYGVAVDAANEAAVSKLLSFKNRPAGKPISILVTDQAMAESFVELNPQAEGLYAAFLPGPVTVVSKALGILDPRLSSESGTLGVRISSYPLAQALVEAFGAPITATSANASGKARPYSVEIVLSGLSERQQGLLDLVLDAGELPRNEPSTVIDTTQEVQEIVRAGAFFDQLAKPTLSNSEEETIAEAARLMTSLLHAVPEKTVVFALEGEMGAGKTRFAKGVAQALGVKVPVSSPTYTIMKEYEGAYRDESVQLVHMDCWRLEGANPEELGLSDLMKPQTVLVVEWAAPLLHFFKSHADRLVGYHIHIEEAGETDRRIRVASL